VPDRSPRPPAQAALAHEGQEAELGVANCAGSDYGRIPLHREGCNLVLPLELAREARLNTRFDGEDRRRTGEVGLSSSHELISP
jgi:hypothetical protein